MGKFRMQASHLGGDKTWWEEYDKPEVKSRQDAKRWCRATVNEFNDSLRPGEIEREIHRVEWLSGETDHHSWTKTNLVTLFKGGDMYDTMKCEACGVTGKRYGLGPVTIDPRYSKAKVYRSCARTQEHIRGK